MIIDKDRGTGRVLVPPPNQSRLLLYTISYFIKMTTLTFPTMGEFKKWYRENIESDIHTISYDNNGWQSYGYNWSVSVGGNEIKGEAKKINHKNFEIKIK